jgi:hypothetical protein
VSQSVGAWQVLGLGRRDVIREGGFGLDDSVWITVDRGAFVDGMHLPSAPVLDGAIKGATVMKVRTTMASSF